MITLPLRSASLLLAAVLATAACGSDDSASTDGAEPAATAAGDAASPAVASAAVRVASIAFQPASLTVPVGTTVTWTNEDANVRHTATSGSVGTSGVPGVSEGEPDEPDGVFDVDLPDAGATGSHTFDEPGTYAYFCDVHPSMTGEVVVE